MGGTCSLGSTVALLCVAVRRCTALVQVVVRTIAAPATSQPTNQQGNQPTDLRVRGGRGCFDGQPGQDGISKGAWGEGSSRSTGLSRR